MNVKTRLFNDVTENSQKTFFISALSNFSLQRMSSYTIAKLVSNSLLLCSRVTTVDSIYVVYINVMNTYTTMLPG